MDSRRLQELAGNTPARPQIRYYDWIAALFFADLATGLLLLGLLYDGTTWYMSFIWLVLGFGVIDLWTYAYCPFRKRQEVERCNESIK